VKRRGQAPKSAALARASAALLCVGAVLSCTPANPRRQLPAELAPPRATVDEGHPGSMRLHATWEGMPGDAGSADLWLLGKQTAAWATRWKLVSEATESIDAAYFIIETDPFGLAFLGLLQRKAREGVKVRLLVDGRGSVALTTPLAGLDYLHELIEAGDVEVKLFNPVAARLPETLISMSAIPVSSSSHQKLLIVDRKVAVTGGRNVSLPYFADYREFAKA
jgi:hypothetical protein